MNTIWKRNIVATAGVNRWTRQHEAARPEEAEVLAEEVHGELARERRVPAEAWPGRRRRPSAGRSRRVQKPEDADGVDQEVHAHRVGDVLRAREPGLDQREPGLHEHDEEAGDHRPDDVQRGLRVGERLHDVRGRGIHSRAPWLEESWRDGLQPTCLWSRSLAPAPECPPRGQLPVAAARMTCIRRPRRGGRRARAAGARLRCGRGDASPSGRLQEPQEVAPDRRPRGVVGRGRQRALQRLGRLAAEAGLLVQGR